MARRHLRISVNLTTRYNFTGLPENTNRNFTNIYHSGFIMQFILLVKADKEREKPRTNALLTLLCLLVEQTILVVV